MFDGSQYSCERGNDPYGPTTFETEAIGSFGAFYLTFYCGERYTFVALPTGYGKLNACPGT